jgi:hypothetical protein
MSVTSAPGSGSDDGRCAAAPVSAGTRLAEEDGPWDFDDYFAPENAPPDEDEAFPADPWTGAGESIPAGFLHHDSGRNGSGFAAGGVLDELAPGPVLAGFVADAATDGQGLPGLGESELVGFLCAARRMASWAAAQEAEAVITLCRRRAAQARERKNPHLAEHVPGEVAAALTLTGQAASRLVDICGYLERLPEVRAALAAGIIDWARAVVFADELATLDDAAARRAARRVLPRAGGMTTAQLRRALRRERELADPDAARRRREQGRKDAAVHRWDEPSGNSALAGREMTPADAITADARLTAQARWLQARGATGTLDQLRCAVFAAVLNGRRITTLLPRGNSAANPAPAEAAHDRLAGAPATGSPDAVSGGNSSGGMADPDAAGITGSVHLTMPLSAWLWLTDRPGEVAGSGTADAGTCRDLATQLAAHPATRWCLTLTDQGGTAVGHACARHGPSPPGTGTRTATGTGAIRWLASLRPDRLESGDCTHQRQVPGYRPPRSLRHLITIRQQTCGAPGCRRPAVNCDLDHAVPYDQGGRTCECNLHPACRRHHQAKQAPGWHLHQPQPGTLVWTLPSGRSYTTRPDPYPT